jgi:4a-hydroxytetrahydrobiopterin dehydratase
MNMAGCIAGPAMGYARAMAQPLTQAQIDDALGSLPGWTFEGDKLHREYGFGSFKEALSFIVRIGLHAEEANHHPEIFNVYSTVKIALNTHDAGGKVTAKDVALAKVIEDVDWSS